MHPSIHVFTHSYSSGIKEQKGQNRRGDRGAGEGEGSGAGETGIGAGEGSSRRGRGEEQGRVGGRGITLGTSSFQAGEESVRREGGHPAGRSLTCGDKRSKWQPRVLPQRYPRDFTRQFAPRGRLGALSHGKTPRP